MSEDANPAVAGQVERRVGRHACCVLGDCSESTCMALPDGKTCGDCVRVDYCTAIWGDKPTSTVCGYFPRRFSETPNVPIATIASEDLRHCRAAP